MAIHSKGGYLPPAPSTPPPPGGDTTESGAPVAVSGGVHRKTLPADVWAATGPTDAFGGSMNSYGQYTYPSSEAMRAAMRSPGVIQKMQSGEYGSQWQELTSDPVSLYGLFTGETQDVSSGPFDDILPDLGKLDFTGLTSAFLGDPNPHGLLGLQIDPIADLLGAKPEEILGLGRAGAGMLNPAVAVGMQVAPSLAYGAPFDMEDTLKRAALSAGVGYAADFAAPYVSAAFDDLPAGDVVADAGAPPMPPAGATPMTGEFPMPAAIPVSSPEQAASTFGSPASLPGYDAAYGMLSASDLANRDALEAGDYPAPEPEPTVTSADLQRYAKVAQTVNQMLGGDAGGPVQDEGESQEQFTGELADYLGLDAETMAAEGLQPGSPEYMEYIMARADAVIGAVLGDMDVDSADLAVQLRGKTEAELLQLQRALYVRGQMDQLMRSGTYSDPYSGAPQEVIGEGMFNPNVGAYQRGVAGDVEQLAGMSGPDALSFLSERLGRSGDPFGMQASADARMRQAELEPQDDLRRRRGMFGY